MRLTIGLSAGALLLSLVALIIGMMRMPFTYAEMDLNQNGWLEVSEISYFFDHGAGHISIEGATCAEYYALKDVIPLKVVCGDSRF